MISFSQQQTPRTLLWRISGKGLDQPSYLFGTMHLQDKRLFQFGDSVYRAIETTQGLATEINFEEVMDSVISKREAEAQREKQLATIKYRIDPTKLGAEAKKLLQKFGIRGTMISAKELEEIQNYRMQNLLQRGEMQTVVDGFLLGLAQRQGKWTGGIEDFDDQFNLRDGMGSELTPEDVLQPEAAFRRAVDTMINLYIAQDIDGIETWCNRSLSGRGRDALLIKRNVKMAYRMDSLSAVRPTFFAIGAAHLSGDSGVIQLLQNRGFRVEPVFSTHTIASTDYASQLQQKEWKEIKGTGDAYTVQMPGAPTDVNKPGEGPQLKMYLDLTTMTLFMVSHFSNYNAKTRSLDMMLQDAAKNISGKEALTPPVAISYQGLQGKETTAVKDGYTFRIRVFAKGNVFYMLAVGSAKKEMINSPDAHRFFTSFVPTERSIAKDWQPFAPQGKAILVRMPGNPEQSKAIDEKIEGNPYWRFTTYQSIDPQSSFFYLLQTRQVNAGFNIDNDAAYFDELKKDYENRLERLTRFEVTEYKGYPAAYMEYEVDSVDARYKSLIVVRGNQVHVLMGGAPRSSDVEEIDFFLQSLELLPYEAAAWQNTGGPGFSTQAPAAFIKNVDSTAAQPLFYEQYYAYDEKNATTYSVQKAQFSPTYWAVSDSLFFEEKLKSNIGREDSLWQRSWVQNGSTKGIDFLVGAESHSSLKKIRMLVNRDTLYTLLAIVQKKELEKAQHLPFFDAFRLQNEVTPVIYQSKATQLLQALTTTDSAHFAQAQSDLDAVQFQKEDLPLLHKSLLENYTDEEEYYSTHSKLIEHILPLADTSTLAFVSEEYPRLQGRKEINKYRLLQLLAKMKTDASFAMLKDHLLLPLPKAGNAIWLQRQLLDSVQLTATLFPEVLQKANDSLLATVIAVAANQLLNDSLLKKEDLTVYKQTILQGAQDELKLLQKGDYEPWELIRWAHLLGWLNEPEGNAFLRKLLIQKDTPLKQAAILALLRNGATVPATEITTVAADRSTRLFFFEALQEIGKERLFPAQYATQKSLAESELYNLFAEDYEDFGLTYIGQRTAAFGGGRRLFHLFKLSLPDEEDGTTYDYLCIAGPYQAGTKEKILYGKVTGVYGDEPFHPQKIDRLLKAYLLQMDPAGK